MTDATAPMWQGISTALKDGTRHIVSHNMDPSSLKIDGIFGPTTAIFQGGKWVPSAYFICIDGVLRSQPTHWLPPTA